MCLLIHATIIINILVNVVMPAGSAENYDNVGKG